MKPFSQRTLERTRVFALLMHIYALACGHASLLEWLTYAPSRLAQQNVEPRVRSLHRDY